MSIHQRQSEGHSFSETYRYLNSDGKLPILSFEIQKDGSRNVQEGERFRGSL